jgi:hypothetical protein
MTYPLIILCLHFCISINSIFAFPTKSSSSRQTVVLVSGAGHGVGFFVMQKLFKKHTQFRPIGLVENQRDAKNVLSLGVSKNDVITCDSKDKQELIYIFDNTSKISKVILCNSAKPRRKIWPRLRNLLMRKPKDNLKSSELYYGDGEDPYHIDYLAQKNMIDVASKCKVDHIVLLSCMGGYRGSHLNQIGRKQEGDDKKGNLLLWKRRTERYLMKRNFFTIIHAGPLTDDKGGQTEIVFDTDDALLRTNFKTISEEDCAEVLVQSLLWREAIGRSIDVGSRPTEGSKYQQDWLRFWSRPGDCVYPV